jgi:hypothetical protein
MATASSSTINIGTLVLDLYDPATKQLVWTGNATKTIDPSSNQEKNQKNLDKAMAKLLKITLRNRNNEANSFIREKIYE